jgi:hypothetical protein
MIRVGFIIGLVSNSVLDNGVGDVGFSIEEAIGDVVGLPSMLESSFGNLFGGVNVTVGNILVLVQQVPNKYLAEGGSMYNLVYNTTNQLRALQTQWDTLNTLAVALVFSPLLFFFSERTRNL